MYARRELRGPNTRFGPFPLQIEDRSKAMLQTYGKSVVAFLYAVATIAVPLFSGDHHIDPSEGTAIAIAVCTNGLVYLVPLVPSAPWTKSAIGAVLAGLQVVTVVIVGGVDSNDVLLIAAAVASFLGISIAPATSPKTATAVGWGADHTTTQP
jgi:hypothetical protein